MGDKPPAGYEGVERLSRGDHHKHLHQVQERALRLQALAVVRPREGTLVAQARRQLYFSKTESCVTTFKRRSMAWQISILSNGSRW